MTRGRWYYDTIASWWCNVHGHNHPLICEAIRRQVGLLDHVLFAGFTHKPAILLAEKLTFIAPPHLEAGFLLRQRLDGRRGRAEDVFSVLAAGRPGGEAKVHCADHGYHGDTIGAMSVSGLSRSTSGFHPSFSRRTKRRCCTVIAVPRAGKAGACGAECVRPIEALLRKRGSEIAGIILEPLVRAAGGMIIYPPAYLEKVGELAGEARRSPHPG